MTFIMIDGIDGVGKTLIQDSIIENFKTQNIFNLEEYLKRNEKYPQYENIKNYDLIISSEPSYATIGKYIREELIKNGNIYSTATLAQAYALDRNILYENIIIPALKDNKTIIQSRGIITSLIYQKLTGNNDDFSLDQILALPGNQLALKYAPDYIVIPYLDDVKIAIERINSREKKDDAIFEKLDFLERAQLEYKSKELIDFFAKFNSKIIYINNTYSIENTKKEINEFFIKYNLCN